MSKQGSIKIIQTDLLEHPAVKAWSELQSERVKPDRIEVLKLKKERAVYRLPEVGPGNSAVIAKRARQEKAVIERTIYEKVLPNLPMTTLHYYGSTEEEDGRFWWLFLEDAGDQQYSPLVEEHRIMAARWLGAMHAAAEGMIVKAPLPNRGPDYYLNYLRAAREAIPQLRAFSALKTTDQAVLENIVSMCELLEMHWGEVEAFCDRMPRTFIHGDCLVKNVHVRMTQDGLTVAPFDWAGAGWGLPATDLGQLGLPYHSLPLTTPDIATYLAVVQDQWPSLDVQIVQQLANLGQMFWSLKVISLGVPEFNYERAHIESIVDNLSVYASVLANAIRSARWEN